MRTIQYRICNNANNNANTNNYNRQHINFSTPAGWLRVDFGTPAECQTSILQNVTLKSLVTCRPAAGSPNINIPGPQDFPQSSS